MPRPAHLLLIGLLATAGCGGSSTATTDTSVLGATTVSSTATPTAEPSVTEPVTDSTTETADPPADEPPVATGPAPSSEASMTVAPTQVRVGDDVEVTVFCTFTDSASVRFGGAEHSGVQVPPTPDDPQLFVTTAVVPYYLEPGIVTVRGGCIDDIYPAPVEIEVLPSLDGVVELWRPIRPPWAEPDRAAGTPPPPLVEAAYVDDEPVRGTPISVHAVCDARIPRSGARFVLWIESGGDQFAVEFPVPDDGYDPIDTGVVISADVIADQAAFDASGIPHDWIHVSALCVPTPTPFTSAAEPDLPRLLL